MAEQEYSIGLDIGTNSVGWAIVDASCALIRHKHQNMSGSHLFAEANKAEKRRGFRASRRRANRRKQRIVQLQMLMEHLVEKIDPAFYKRLRESMLHADDKNTIADSNILFGNSGYTDADYRREYPTIYHLRRVLTIAKDKKDIRLVYLAIHHIIKYRGHFLYEGMSLAPGESDMSAVQGYMAQLDTALADDGSGASSSLFDNADTIIDILGKAEFNPSIKAKMISQLFVNHDQASAITELAKLMVGNAGDVSKITGIESEVKSFKFSDTEYEDVKRDKLQSDLGDEFALIEAAESIYKWSLLQSVLKGCHFISEAMVKSYDDYSNDLQTLKHLYKKYATTREYTEFFRKHDNNHAYGYDSKAICYSNYENRGNTSIDDLTKHIRKQFANNQAALNSPEYKRFDTRASLGTFLQKQRIRANGAIPNQIHVNELRAILDNQSAHYPELAHIKDKILSIASFRIPYHVGPLKTGGKFAWSVKKEGATDQIIYPWNFEDIIDVDKSAEEFIARMRNTCTYLPGESVLPKCSLLYAEYELRNELKSVRINEELLDITAQNRLVSELFTKQKSVSHAALKRWLTAEGIYSRIESITGTQQESRFASSLAAQIDFASMGLDSATHRDAIEQIIEWITLFEDKKILKQRLKSLDGTLSEPQLQKCLKLRYAGWGRLSRTLLAGIREDCGELGACTVIDIMREVGPAHFMQIVDSDKYPFKKRIAEIQKESWGDKTVITYDDIDSLAGSPGIKRGIWRSIRIVNEVVDIMGYAPKSINIEMARNEADKKRTESRQRKLLKLYETYIQSLADKHNRAHAKEQVTTLKAYSNDALSSQRLYLYFLQNGKCAYTGHDLDIERLSTYDIDHVIPRALLKDDSIDNTVLVTQLYNREKSCEYPLKPEIISKMRGMWSMWRDAGFMTDTKYRRLTRINPLKEDEVQTFINRQIVETRQITKHVARMLTEQYRDGNTAIRTIRAGLASEYRRVHDLPKSRELNDFHHAKDAYLAAVIGEFLAQRYPDMDKGSLYGAYKRYQQMRTSKLNASFVIAEMDKDICDTHTGEFTWYADDAHAVIERTMGYNDVLVTKMVETSDAEFYNQNAVSASEGSRIPIKPGLDPAKYGGYTGENGAYSIGVEWSDGKKIKRQLLKLPISISSAAKSDMQKIVEYLRGQLGENSNPKIVLPMVRKNQKIIRGGSLQYIASDNEVHSAKQFTLPLAYQRKLIPLLKRRSAALLSPDEEAVLNDFIHLYLDKLNQQYPMYRSEHAKLDSARTAMLALDSADKLDAIKKLLILTKQGAGEPDMSKPASLKLASRFGRKTGTLHIDEIDFVYESITGLHRRIVKGKDL